MSRKGFRWEIIAVTAVLTLAVLSLANYSYQTLGVKRPLERALQMDPDISAVRIYGDRDTQVIEVTFSAFADLSATYRRVDSLIRNRVGMSAFRVDVKDARNVELQDAYHAIHYYLEEALVRGNFGAMVEACESILTKAGAFDSKVTVDRNHIYVEIRAGANYLYQVLDRSPEAQEGGITP